MYAEVYRWFTETSGLGLMEQVAALMHPKQASKEEDIAEAVEAWLEKVNRLGRHGSEHQPPGSFKKVALEKILVGKLLDNYELWNMEKLTFEEILRRVRDLARANQFDTDAAHGKAGVKVGKHRTEESQPEPAAEDASGAAGQQPWGSVELSIFNKGKGKGKGKKGKCKGKCKG